MREWEGFRDRRHAGALLARDLRSFAPKGEVIVLGLTRGGIPVAAEVAAALGAPLDAIVVRKVGAPEHEELAIGALAPEGIMVRNSAIISSLGVTEHTLEAAAKRERAELLRRERLYRDGRPYPELSGRTVIIVDDGLATGATMRAAITWVERRRPARIVVAAPVASAETCRQIEDRGSGIRCVCHLTPDDFYAIGQWYGDFSPVSDAEVIHLLTPESRPSVEVAPPPAA